MSTQHDELRRRAIARRYRSRATMPQPSPVELPRRRKIDGWRASRRIAGPRGRLGPRGASGRYTALAVAKR